jgi:ubiquitin-protein ligase
MLKRLARERTFLDPAIHVSEEIPEPQTYDRHMCWKLSIPQDPQDPKTPYTVVLTFSKNYPFKSPSIKIPEPPGILDGICCCHNTDGTLCVSDFLTEWSPQLTVSYILQKIHRLLTK